MKITITLDLIIAHNAHEKRHCQNIRGKNVDIGPAYESLLSDRQKVQ